MKAFLTPTSAPARRASQDNGYIPIPEAFKPKLAAAVAAILE